MKWESPISQLNFLRAVIALTAFDFVIKWRGHGNLPGPDQRGWGDPIPFDEAVLRLPGTLLTSLFVVGLLVLLKGIRSSGPRPTPAVPEGDQDQLSKLADEQKASRLRCPLCQQRIQITEISGATWRCQGCSIDLQLAARSNMIGAVANVVGFLVALLSYWNEAGFVGFVFIWFVAAYLVAASIEYLVPQRLVPMPPPEFHRQLP